MILRYAAVFVVLAATPAYAVDEIQVYNAEIAKVGQYSLEHHSNYAINGRKTPDFPGGLVPNHAFNATPELAYGVTDWYELGLYLPYAIDETGSFYSNGFKIRHLFVVPDAGKREFFYGVNVEFSYTTPKFSETRFATEIRPIIGWRKGDYEFIVNPIVDIGFGSSGEVEFFPAARFAKKFGESFALGVEYYSGYGPFGRFLPLSEQQQNVFGVVDFKVGRFDVNAGLGYGMTKGSDRLLAKLIIGMDLN
jgi:hypothetical protein